MQRYEAGRKLKDTLMGEARQGRGYFLHATTGELTCIDVLLKSFNKQCVLNGVTLNGQPVAEDPRTELTLQTRVSTPASYPASLQQSPSYLDRIAVQCSSHIVKLYDVKDDGDAIVAIMEFAAGGELFSLLSSSGPSFSLAHAKTYTVQLLLAVHALHTLDIVHRDISLENILLTRDHSLRLCDFGLAREVPRGERLEEKVAVGKTRYMSPEVFSCIAYDPRLSDVWSVGVCLFVMCMKNFPWNFPHSSDPLFVMICSGRVNDVMRGWGRPQLDDALVDLFSHFFCPEERRWSIQQLLESDWLRGVWNAPRETAAAPPVHSRAAASAPASLAVSTSSSVASSPPPGASAGGVGAGSASPLTLSTASLEDLSANEPAERSLSPAVPPAASLATFPSSTVFDGPGLSRSMSPSFALPPSSRPAFVQPPLFFQLQETAVMRSLDLSSHHHSEAAAAPPPPEKHGGAVTADSGHSLYPTSADAAALVSGRGELPVGPSLDHSKSRRDR